MSEDLIKEHYKAFLSSCGPNQRENKNHGCRQPTVLIGERRQELPWSLTGENIMMSKWLFFDYASWGEPLGGRWNFPFGSCESTIQNDRSDYHASSNLVHRRLKATKVQSLDAMRAPITRLATKQRHPVIIKSRDKRRQLVTMKGWKSRGGLTCWRGWSNASSLPRNRWEAFQNATWWTAGC